MKWFIMIFLCILCWSAGDLCYKKGSEGEDTTTPLQFLVWLGIVMGTAMFFLLPYSEKQLPLLQLTMSYIDYAPFAVAYVAALLVGLMGKRFLDASVLSPLENIDGAISGILLLIIFVVTGDIRDLREQFSVADLIGFVLVTAGTVYLGVIEQRKANAENAAPHSDKARHRRAGAAVSAYLQFL